MTGLCVYLREALRLETHVKRVIIFFFSFCIGGTSEKRENRNKIEPDSPRDLILGSLSLPQTSLSILAEIRVLLKISQNMAQIFFRKTYIFVSGPLPDTRIVEIKRNFSQRRVFEISRGVFSNV